MRIFVAGGTGAIGRRLIPALIADGHQVTASTRSAAKSAGLAAAGAVHRAELHRLHQRVRRNPGQDRGRPDKLRHLGQVSDLAQEPPPGTR